MKISSTTLFVTLASAAVLLAVVAGVVIIGSPTQVRMYRMDEQRVQDLRSISNSIEVFRNVHSALPDTLDKLLTDSSSPYLHVTDPESKLPYEYKINDAASYVLCAQFGATSRTSSERTWDVPNFWNHGAGRQCFNLKARGQIQH